MRTLCILTIYNEIEFLPYKLKYTKENDLDLYIIDNMSNDGSWEWLQDNNIKSHRFDTQGMFHLKALQNEMIKTVHKEKPDWAIYNGCDLFPLIEGSLGKKLEEINKEGYNLATIDYLMFCNTGEKRGNPFTTYFYFHSLRNLMMIHKYDPNLIKILNELKEYRNSFMHGNTRASTQEAKESIVKVISLAMKIHNIKP